MRISDWSSDVCSSDLTTNYNFNKDVSRHLALASTTRMDIRLKRSLRPIFSKNRIPATMPESKSDLCVRYYIQDGGSGRTRTTGQIGRASWRERVCQYE